MADNDKIAADAARALEADRKAAEKARSEALAASRKASEADTKAAAERQSYQPTPTQEENDRAKLGISSLDDLDDKEDSGAPTEEDARVAAAKADLARAEAARPPRR